MSSNKLIIWFIAVLITVGLGAAFLMANTDDDPKDNNNNNSNVTQDMRDFKAEYEFYNGKDADNGATYQTLNIPEYNLIKYASIDEILDMLGNETGVIVFGAPTCPWCRGAFPVLIEAAKDSDIENIHYITLSEDRSSWEVIDGELVKTSEGHARYYELLETLDSEIVPFSVTDQNGKSYETGEKRIRFPLVVFVRDGEIIGSHYRTVELPAGQSSYDSLTSEQIAELKALYSTFIEEMLGAPVCTETCE